MQPSATNLYSADVTVYTEDNDYALRDGKLANDLPGKEYKSLYVFLLSAHFPAYPSSITFQSADIDFYIKDECYAMTILGPAQIQMSQNNYNLTASGQPHTYNISKYLFSNASHFVFEYVDYLKWSPPATAAYALNYGCGELTYKIVNKSWVPVWGEGNNLLYIFPGDLALQDDGILFELETKERYQIGDHSV